MTGGCCLYPGDFVFATLSGIAILDVITYMIVWRRIGKLHSLSRRYSWTVPRFAWRDRAPWEFLWTYIWIKRSKASCDKTVVNIRETYRSQDWAIRSRFDPGLVSGHWKTSGLSLKRVREQDLLPKSRWVGCVGVGSRCRWQRFLLLKILQVSILNVWIFNRWNVFGHNLAVATGFA